MPDERDKYELIEIGAASPAPIARLIRAGRSRLGRLAARLTHARTPHPRAHRSSPGVTFEISGLRATFEELERIVFDPVVMARVERAPSAPLVRHTPSPIDVTRIAEQQGWRPRARPARIVDVTPFAFELDMLELRLTELSEVVDQFVVAEASRGFGGMRKPLYLQRNWQRLASFHAQLTHIVVDDATVGALYPGGRRERTDWIGENALRIQLWQHVRTIAREPNVIVIWADVDELLPRWFIHLLKHYECPMPLRVQAPACRYHFGWRDPEATAGITVFDAGSVGWIDHQPALVRSMPARTFSARGAVHMTSFLDPAVLQMKFAVTTEWEPEVERYIRNAHHETAAMIEDGTWFGRPLLPYDAEADPLGLVPASARLNRARYPSFWPVGDAGMANQFE